MQDPSQVPARPFLKKRFVPFNAGIKEPPEEDTDFAWSLYWKESDEVRCRKH